LHVKKAGLSAIEKIAEQEGETVVCGFVWIRIHTISRHLDC
jgi:hypothetical protein